MLCLISAIETELQRLVEQLQATKDSDRDLWMADQPDVVLATVGVGYLECAVRLNRILDRFPLIDQVLFIGSAGVYPNVATISPGNICCCRETLLVDGAAELGLSRYAEPLPRHALPASQFSKNDLHPATVATLLTLTQSDRLAATIRKNLAVELENMELYGVAAVCLQRSLPWNAVLGVTNHVGSSGHTEWKSTFRQIAGKVGDYVMEWLQSDPDLWA